MNQDELKNVKKMLERATRREDWDGVLEAIDLLSEYIETDFDGDDEICEE